MAEQESFQEKTEQASPKKKEEARKKGQVAKSREISSIAVLAAGAIYLFFSAKKMVFQLGNQLKTTFSGISSMGPADVDLMSLLSNAVSGYLIMVLPLMLVLIVVALLANYLQVGVVWSVDPLTPKASKINPIEGGKKIFSKRSLVEGGKAIFKLLIVAWAAFSILRDEYPRLVPLIYQDNIQIISTLGYISMKLVIRCSCIIAILAILDFIYQKWELEESLKMTKQEVKDEFKQTDGDPLIKARIRSIQREMARRRMMEEVPKADVVITNPTHLSIAIRYDSNKEMAAPVIVAKGANNVAMKIREVAEKNNIPLVENKSLARNLNKLEIGDEIPSKFYQVIAEILAYVYGLKKNAKAY
ncbi:MAG: flagellar biosynthesis protein FlhB [Deltaproteobacteria bacterium]|nr:flagellar biosynthesis protein FlhB [Deltaproteobacteria bacterium]